MFIHDASGAIYPQKDDNQRCSTFEALRKKM